MRANTCIWAVLLVLSVLSFSMSGATAAALILSTAGVKSALVGWQFMELRRAHVVWRLGLFALLAGVLGLVWLLAR
jgi:ABC-type Co2+ transport system permease subunit